MLLLLPQAPKWGAKGAPHTPHTAGFNKMRKTDY